MCNVILDLKKGAITYGVLQDSVLGPLSFILYIDDTVFNSSSKYLIFVMSHVPDKFIRVTTIRKMCDNLKVRCFAQSDC